MTRFKMRVMLPMGVMGLLAIALFALTLIREAHTQLAADVGRTIAAAEASYHAMLAERADKMGAVLTALAERPDIRNGLRSGDRAALLRAASPLFESLRGRYRITHFYFHDAQRLNLLRVHQPRRHGDRIERYTLLQAQRTGRLVHGAELGPLGTFTLRAVLPMRDGEHVLGYLELGEDLGSILGDLGRVFGLEFMSLIDKRLLDREGWEAGMRMLQRAAEWNRYPNLVQVSGAASMLPAVASDALLARGGAAASNLDLTWRERRYLGRILPLEDAGGREVGRLVVLNDASAQLRQNRVVRTVSLSLALGVLGLAFLYIVLGRAERRLAASRERLADSQGKFQALVENSSDWIWEIDAHAVYTYASPKLRDLLGYAPEEVIGKTPFDLMPPEEAARVGAIFGPIAAARQPFQGLENVNRHKDGRLVVLETSGAPVFGSDGRFAGYRGVDRDVTARKEAQARLRQSATVFESTTQGVIITDPRGGIVDVNRAFTAITGYAREEAVGENPRMLASGRYDGEFYQSLWAAVQDTGHWQGEIWNRRKDGAIYPEWLNITAVKGEDGQTVNYVGVFSDITLLKDSQSKLDHLAHHDPLTGLPNRLAFDMRLRYSLERAQRDGSQIAVMFVDLDHFKNVNDTLGHPAGDQLLQEAARRFAGLLRQEDTVARIGGDEFMMIVEQLSDGASAVTVAQKLIEASKRPFQIDGHMLYLSASVGISLSPRDGRDADALIRHADAALYRAKAEGRSNFRFYTEDLTARAVERLTLENGLRTALEKREFVLEYQPQVDLETGRFVSAEALIRWRHPELGLVAPDRFISLAENNGMILPIGEWVLRTACAQAQAWREAGLALQGIAVNVSSVQMQRGAIVDTVRRVLDETGLPPHCLEIELTESVIMRDAEQAAETLGQIKRLGVRITIDDFGTGYSSLGYLKRLPIDKLKIDRSFVTGLPDDGNDCAIVRAVLALAKSLRMRVIAEGVETAEQRVHLLAEGCDEGQGYLFGKPLDAEALARRFAAV